MNKEQRGYLTPEEFNKIGEQAQFEIFNSYFEELNQQLRTPENDSEYANRVRSLEEKLEYFKQTPTALTFFADSGASSQYFAPPESSTIVNSESITTTSAQVYNLTIPPQTVKDGTLNVFLNGAEISSPADYIISTDGTSIQLTSIPVGGGSLTINVYENNFYKLGTVIYNNPTPSENVIQIEEVDRVKLLKLNNSSYSKPDKNTPVYVYENNKLFIRPTSIVSNVIASFIRKPIAPKWDFTVDTASQAYVYNYNTSVNFELDAIEQTSLVIRILLYAGVVVKDPQVVQVAASQIQQEQANEKS
jgi:hypothetical protein